MSKKIELSIVILNYNGEKYLPACLASLPENDLYEVIIPDNGSTDKSLEFVRRNYPKTIIVENKKNLGFAAGNNVGFKQAKGEYILILNPDTVVQPNTIETVLDYMRKHPEVGAATCRVELPDGSLDYSSHRGFPNPANSLLHFLGFRKYSTYSSAKISDDIHEIDALTGAFALVRKSAGDQVNWFDEDYFWNGEDIDMCYKLHEAGWKVMFIPTVKTIHYKGSASKASLKRKLAWAKNSTDVMTLFYKKHLAKKYSPLVNIASYSGIKCLYLVRLLKAFI